MNAAVNPDYSQKRTRSVLLSGGTSSTRERVAVIQPLKTAHPPGRVTAGLRPPSANRGEERGHPGDLAGPFPDKLTFHKIFHQSIKRASSILTTSHRPRYWDCLSKIIRRVIICFNAKPNIGANVFSLSLDLHSLTN